MAKLWELNRREIAEPGRVERNARRANGADPSVELRKNEKNPPAGAKTVNADTVVTNR